MLSGQLLINHDVFAGHTQDPGKEKEEESNQVVPFQNDSEGREATKSEKLIIELVAELEKDFFVLFFII